MYFFFSLSNKFRARDAAIQNETILIFILSDSKKKEIAFNRTGCKRKVERMNE